MNFYFFFFNDTATTEIYTLSLHDALPISNFLISPNALAEKSAILPQPFSSMPPLLTQWLLLFPDRKSTRLNSSHANISYAVFCLKKKKYQLVSIHISPI